MNRLFRVTCLTVSKSSLKMDTKFILKVYTWWMVRKSVELKRKKLLW